MFGLSNIDDIFNRDFKNKTGVTVDFFKKSFSTDDTSVSIDNLNITKESLIENSHKFTKDELILLSSSLDSMMFKIKSSEKLINSRISYLKADEKYLKNTLNSSLPEHGTIDCVIDSVLSGDTTNKFFLKTFSPISSCYEKGSFIYLDSDNCFEVSSDDYVLALGKDSFKISFNSVTHIDSILFNPVAHNDDVFNVFVEGSDKFSQAYSNVNISELKRILIQNRCLSISFSGAGSSNLLSLPFIVTARDDSDTSCFSAYYSYDIKTPSNVESSAVTVVVPEGTVFFYVKKNMDISSETISNLLLNFSDAEIPDNLFKTVESGVSFDIDLSAYYLAFYSQSSSSFVRKPMILNL